MRLVLISFLLLTSAGQALAATFEAECRTKTAVREPIVTRVKLVQTGVMWQGEAVIAGIEAERLFVRLQETNDEISFNTSIMRNEKIVGLSETEILWRDEDARTGYPVVDNPDASALIVMSGGHPSAQTVVICSIHQN